MSDEKPMGNWMKITQYGYPNDECPDDNTKAKIGGWDNSLRGYPETDLVVRFDLSDS